MERIRFAAPASRHSGQAVRTLGASLVDRLTHPDTAPAARGEATDHASGNAS